MRAFLPVSAVLPIALLAASCNRSNPVAPRAPDSVDAFVVALQAQGATASRGEVLPNALPCLSVSGHVVRVNSGFVNAFEYPTPTAAATDASNISPDGSGVVGTGCAALITWVGPPHFYRRDQLIVVYAGSADDVLRPLEAVLGRPFATR